MADQHLSFASQSVKSPASGEERARVVKYESRLGTARTESHTSLPSHSKKPPSSSSLSHRKPLPSSAAALSLSQRVGVMSEEETESGRRLGHQTSPRSGQVARSVSFTSLLAAGGAAQNNKNEGVLARVFLPSLLPFCTLTVRFTSTKERRKSIQKFRGWEGREVGRIRKPCYSSCHHFPVQFRQGQN